MAEFLEGRGYRASALEGGFDAWKNQGFRAERLDEAVRRAA